MATLIFHRPGPLVPPADVKNPEAGERRLWRPIPALLNGYVRWDTSNSVEGSKSGEWAIDWAPEDGVTIRLDDQQSDATAYAPFVDIFLDWEETTLTLT